MRKLAQNNCLANLRLHAACARLQPGEFAAMRTGFFPSLRATLNHIHIVDCFYVDALEGGTLGVAAFADEEPHADIAALAAAQAGLDARLLALVTGLNAAAFARPVTLHRQDRVQIERCDDVLSHLFQHQTHHRGQAHAMLSSSSVKPPQLDEFIVADDARFRAGELAALGWSEADLMGA